MESGNLIDRQAAIHLITGYNGVMDKSVAKRLLTQMPPAQPERLTDDDFETIRIHLSAYKERLCNQRRWKEAEEYQRIIDRFMTFASAQPEPQWIPCGERLPDPMGWDECYLVSLAWGGIGVMEFKSTGFHNYGSLAPVPIESVIAWMPLPEPYAERREK